MPRKARDPNTIPGAVRAIVTAIGAKRAAFVTGCTASLVYKWSDPDHCAEPKLSQAVALDREYQNTTDRPGPLHKIMAQLVGDVGPMDADPGIETLEAVEAVGKVAHVIRGALADKRISPNEQAVIAHAVKDAKRELQDVTRAVDFLCHKNYPTLPGVAS